MFSMFLVDKYSDFTFEITGDETQETLNLPNGVSLTFTRHDFGSEIFRKFIKNLKDDFISLH